MTVKSILLLFIFLISFSYSFSQDELIDEELFLFDAIIESEMGGKRMKFYGNTRFNFNQAYFSNWISGGESSLSL